MKISFEEEIWVPESYAYLVCIHFLWKAAFTFQVKDEAV